MNIEQVNAALALLIEASLILRQQDGEIQEAAILISRGMSDVQRQVNAHTVREHIEKYRQSRG